MTDKQNYTEEEIMMYVDGQLSNEDNIRIKKIIESDENAQLIANKFTQSDLYLKDVFSKFDFSNTPEPIIKKESKETLIQRIKNYFNSFTFAQALAIPITAVCFIFVGFQMQNQNINEENNLVFKGTKFNTDIKKIEELFNINKGDMIKINQNNNINVKIISSNDNCKFIKAEVFNKIAEITICNEENKWQIFKIDYKK